MPRPDAAKLIADHVDKLPGADGTTMRLFNFSSFGQEPKVAARIKGLAQEVGDRIIELLEAHKYTLHHPGDPVAAEQPGHKHARIHCQTCGKAILKLSLDDQLQAAIPHNALQAIGRHDCDGTGPGTDPTPNAGHAPKPSSLQTTNPASGDATSQKPREMAGHIKPAATESRNPRRKRRTNNPG